MTEVKKEKKPTKKQYFKNFLKYRFLLWELIKKNIKLQYRNSILGVFWTFLQPLLTMIVLALVFGGIFGRGKGMVNYPIYLLCGRLIFDFYSQATKKAMRSVVSNASIVKKVYVPKYIYPLSSVVSTFITFSISLTVLIFVMGYFNIFTPKKVEITPYILLAIVPILILLLLCIGIGMLLATFEVFFRDIGYLYDVFCMLLFYMTPVFFVVEDMKLSRNMEMVLMANPLYSIVSMFRSCVLYGQMWNWNWFYYSLGVSVFFLVVGVFAFYKKQDKFILHL